MRGKRVDANQPEIVSALRKIPGVTVRTTHTVGHGFPDICVGFKGRSYLFEIKRHDVASRYEPLELAFKAEWTGHFQTIRTWQEAAYEIGVNVQREWIGCTAHTNAGRLCRKVAVFPMDGPKMCAHHWETA